MPRFAANLSLMFTEQPFLERFGAAAAAGFEGVEFLFPYAWPAARIVEELARHELAQVLHNLPPGDWDGGERGLACLPDRIAEFRDGVGLAIDYARTLGCTRLHCMAGIVPAGVDADLVRRTYVDNLAHAAAACAAAGIRLLIEPINSHDMPGYYLNRSAQAMDIIAEVGSDNLYLQYDIYHAQRMEGELANTITRLLPQIAHMQLADTPGRHEPGSGEINYPFLFDWLDRIGYTGWVSAEYIPVGDTAAGLGWLPR